MTQLKCPLREAALISGNEKALLTREGTLTYQQLDQVVSGSVPALLATGVKAESRVALCLGNDWRAIALTMALLRLRAVVCPLNPKLPEAVRLDALRIAGCAWGVSEDGTGPGGEAIRWLGVDHLISMSGPDAGRAPPIRLTVSQPATIFFTSGSRGRSKAVLHSFGNHYYSALGSNQNLPIRSGDAWLWSLPMHHVGGFQIPLRCFLGGAIVAVPAPGVSHPVTHASMVATQLRRHLQALDAGEATAKPRYILLGGGPIPQDLVADALRRDITVLCSYGSTEMTSQVTTVHPVDTPPAQRITAGRALRYREIRIAADGEILVRGQTRFLGYLNGDSLRRPFDADGWFATGDLGALDHTGALTVSGRKDNQFISGGENIQPEEIEQALCRLPGVEDALVVPEPHDDYGMRPVAFVKTADPLPGSLPEQLAAVLPRFKIPDRFLPWPEEAETGLKPDRTAMAQRAETQIG